MNVAAETGDLCVLRIVLDARARADLDATLAGEVSFGSLVRQLTNVLLAHRNAWLRGGAVDAESGRLFDVPDRLHDLLRGERDRLRVLDGHERGPDDGPFRGGVVDDRAVVLVVLAIGVRESPALRWVGKTTLVTIGEIGRGNTLASALEAIGELADGDLLAGEILLRPERGRELALDELARAYARDELVTLRA